MKRDGAFASRKAILWLVYSVDRIHLGCSTGSGQAWNHIKKRMPSSDVIFLHVGGDLVVRERTIRIEL